MTIGDNLTALTQATSDLLAAVNVSKASLDASVASAAAAANNAVNVQIPLAIANATPTLQAYVNQAAASAAIQNILSVPATALPYEVLTISGGVGTGTGGTAGEYSLVATGGPTGHKAYVTIDSTGKIASYRNANPGISNSNTAPTYSLSGVTGLTGATVPTATVGVIPTGRLFYAPTVDNSQILAWGNNAGTLATAPFGGTQISIYTKIRIDSLTGSWLKMQQLFSFPGFISSSGIYNTNGAYMCTDYLPVDIMNVLSLNLLNNISGANVVFFGANNLPISGGSAPASTGYTTTYPTVPANAKYVRFSASNTDTTQLLNYDLKWEKLRYQSLNAEHLVGSNLYDLCNERGYINNSGVLTDNANLILSDYIACVPGRLITYDFYASANTSMIAYFDSSKTFLSGVAGSTGEMVGTSTVPTNAAYFRLSVINQIPVPAAAAFPNTIVYSIAGGSNGISGESFAGNLLATTLTTGYYLNSSGVVTANTQWKVTQSIPVKPFRWVTYRGMAYPGVCNVAFYDNTGTFIPSGSVVPSIATTALTPLQITVQVPSNAVSMIMSQSVPTPDGTDFTSFATISTTNPALSVEAQLPLLYSQATGNSSAIPTIRTGQQQISYGDSITAGTGSTATANAYASIVATTLGATLVNRGYSGDMSNECAVRIFNNSNMNKNANAFCTLQIGTNDLNKQGLSTDYALTSSLEANFKQQIQASILWLATRSEDRVDGGTSIPATNWTSDTTFTSVTGAKSSTNGAVISYTITTTGGPVYVWSRVGNNNGGTFSISVNSGATVIATATASATPATLFSTFNGGTTGVQCTRIPVPAGTYTVTCTVTSATASANDVGIISIGTPSAHTYYASPSVMVGGVLQFRNNDASQYTAQLTYDVLQAVLLAQGDGLDVRYVDNRSALNGTASLMNDELHPNDSGHALLAQPFISAARRAPHRNVRKGTPTSAGPGTPGDSWAWNGYIYIVQPDRTIQRIATSTF